jgi:hypothetical protein
MSLKPPISAGAAYEVRFRAQSEAPGAAALFVGWIPIAGADAPSAQEVRVAPGSEGLIRGEVPATETAFRVDIRVSLLGAAPLGWLSLVVDGSTHVEEAVADETSWTSIVVPCVASRTSSISSRG